MKLALFIPCYMDMLYPDAAMATLELLESLELEIDYPDQQICCGQPLMNNGACDQAAGIAEAFVSTYADYDYVICPSGSCTAMIKKHYHDIIGDHSTCHKVYELCEFLHDIIKLDKLSVSFPYKVGIHQACHGLRELRLAASSELQVKPFDKIRSLLNLVDKIDIQDLERRDECCGFGGTFSLDQEAVSIRMGEDRICQHQNVDVEVIVSADISCLMHMEGIIKRQNRAIKTMHIAEVLIGRRP